MRYTDFTDYSHAELRRMAQALNPGEVMAAADPWRRAADTLKAIRTTLTRASTDAATSWEGSTSDAFRSRMLHLATTINNAASYANDAAITLKAVSEAIAKAKRDMPEEPGGWDQFTDGVGDTFSVLFGADDEDSRTALADQRRLEAATVMQTLAMHYRTAAPMLKPPGPPGSKKGSNPIDDFSEAPTGDPSGYTAVGTLLGGAGIGSLAPGGRNSAIRPTAGPVQSHTSGGAGSDAPVIGASAQRGSSATSEPGVKGVWPLRRRRPAPRTSASALWSADRGSMSRPGRHPAVRRTVRAVRGSSVLR